jgi:excisionase family DNA binding protein
MAKQADIMRARGFIRVTEAARIIGITPKTVYDWVSDGKVEGAQLGSAHYVSVASLVQKLGPDAALLGLPTPPPKSASST